MSNNERVFSQRIIPSLNLEGRTEWYCLAREGMLGPYPTEAAAHAALGEFIAWCQKVGATGDREEAATPTSFFPHPDLMRWVAEGVVDQRKL